MKLSNMLLDSDNLFFLKNTDVSQCANFIVNSCYNFINKLLCVVVASSSKKKKKKGKVLSQPKPKFPDCVESVR